MAFFFHAEKPQAVLGPFTFLALWGFGPCYRFGAPKQGTTSSPPKHGVDVVCAHDWMQKVKKKFVRCLCAYFLHKGKMLLFGTPPHLI